MIREVLRYPHPALKQVARALAPEEDDEVARVAKDLVDTMDSFGHCVGLAATQLNEMVRMVAVDVTGHKKATASNGRLVLVRTELPRDLLERRVRVAEDLADHGSRYMTSGSSGRTVTSTPCSAPTSPSIARRDWGSMPAGSATSSTIA